MNQVKLPAGLMDCSIEFFMQNGELFFLHQGMVQPFIELPIDYANMLSEDLEKHPQAIKALDELGIFDPIKRLEKYASCRYGGFSFSPDFTPQGENNPEFWDCGKHGNCPFEGKLCTQIQAKHGRITRREADYIRLAAQDLCDKQIAEHLFISDYTAKKHRQNVTRKIGCASKAGITAFAFENNMNS